MYFEDVIFNSRRTSAFFAFKPFLLILVFIVYVSRCQSRHALLILYFSNTSICMEHALLEGRIGKIK